jgi:hypothetical protein
MITELKLTTALSSFQILHSKSGNVITPPFREQGNDIKLDYDVRENEVGITITSTTFYKKFFYRLCSRSNYEFTERDNPLITNIAYDDLLKSITEMAQYSLKKHSNIFRQFNYTGIFKYCDLEEKAFEELYELTHEALQMHPAIDGFITGIKISEVPTQN